jgi:hypothetical protein
MCILQVSVTAYLVVDRHICHCGNDIGVCLDDSNDRDVCLGDFNDTDVHLDGSNDTDVCLQLNIKLIRNVNCVKLICFLYIYATSRYAQKHI